MALLYTNENFPLQTARELRRLGHDVLTSLEAGNANRSVPDEEALFTHLRHAERIPLTIQIEAGGTLRPSLRRLFD